MVMVDTSLNASKKINILSRNEHLVSNLQQHRPPDRIAYYNLYCKRYSA